MTIWDFQIKLTKRLFLWSSLSIIAGIVSFLLGNGFWKGFGIQCFAWGFIDLLIATFGMINTFRKRKGVYTEEKLFEESKKIRGILLINVALDVLYVSIGLILVIMIGSKNSGWQGHGEGVILQGGFLFLFDLIHAQKVPFGGKFDLSDAFQAPENQPFLMEGGKPAVLLIHGFPGTPAEMRPLGELLNRLGWTTKGILLPGFGQQINTLGDKNFEEWVEAVNSSLDDLKREHSPVILLGYSFGAALSIIVSADNPPDGLILLAPFWLRIPLRQRIFGFILSPFLPNYFKPFKKADFSNPKVRDNVRIFFPSLDIDDPKIQEELRQISVPVSIFNQLKRMSKCAYSKARFINIPTLILQGKQDKVVLTKNTRKLISKFSNKNELRYLEIDAEHDLINPTNLSWSEVQNAIIDFINSRK